MYFEFAYYDLINQRVSHYAIYTPPQIIWFGFMAYQAL